MKTPLAKIWSKMKIALIILSTILGLIILYGLTLLISAALVDKNKFYDKHSRYYRILLNSATFVVKTACNIRIKVFDEDKLPKDSRFVLICNHRSGFDPLMTYYALKKYDLSFVAKQSVFNIPIFGRIIRKCGFLSIDRDDPKEAMRNLLAAAKLVKDNQVSMGVYPEGTRSKDGKLLPFHNGVIKIAQKAKVPLVIACIQGTELAHKNAPLRKTEVKINILKVIPTEEVIEKRSQDLGDEAFELIKGFLGEE